MNLRITLLSVLALTCLPASLATGQPEALSKNYAAVDPNKPVVCLLPGRVRKVGGRMTYLERRRPEEMAASECEIRGGEYTLYDRANYENALAVWRAAADQGDAVAQRYVGEIYEKGWVDEPDYSTAAIWYAKASEQGDQQAQRRLAYLYENGLGVQKDQQRALALWRLALDLKEDLVLASDLEAAKSAAQKQIDRLLADMEQQNVRTGRLQRSLDELQVSLQQQNLLLEAERGDVHRLEQELQLVSQSAGDVTRLQDLEQQLAARQSKVEDQRIEIELLEADVAAQRAQVTASQRQAAVRARQLEKAEEQLLAQATRGDALLLELERKDQALRSMENKVAQAEAALIESRSRQQQLAGSLDAGDRNSAADKQALQQQLKTVEQEVAQRERQLLALQEESATQRAQFEQQLAQSQVRETDLSSALAASQKEKEALSRKLTASTEKLDLLDKDLTEARYMLADKEASTLGLKEQLAALDSTEDVQRRQLESKIHAQEQQIAELRKERDELVSGWEAMSQERDQVRATLASEVDATSWLNVELEASSSKLASTRDELRLTRAALEQANFSKQQLAQDMSRLEMDLEQARLRGRADRKTLEEQLSITRMQLAEAGSGVDTLRQEALRLESDFEVLGDRQQGRMLAMRSGEAAVPTIDVAPKSARKTTYHAIIIANYDYEFLPDLSSPPYDANELKQILEREYGFNVEVKINLNRSDMYKTLARVREFDEKDSVLLYYAGHGRMDDYGDGYWLPTDYRNTQPLSDTVSSGDLTQTLSQSKAKHLLLVADSCYSGALARNGDPVLRKGIPALVDFWMKNRSRTVLTSGGLKPVLDEGPNNHSVFAGALLQVLEANSGAINGEMLHAQIHGLVQREAARLGYLDQRPQFSAIEDAGHENGQFVFLGPAIRLP